ncbi:DotI/IcmL family type IV secretion protein [Photobacterium kishitanii]|uniref:Uncharacterized protein n=1 Tax=Photobacterium kishitanii TaxID=318456 RepID=A0A2T3KN43_9GAMM|nr:DotI/IcmL family type IV secretion protein [Photobacterium kishitanii]PSV01194.1 hypothetical protein C9J27_03990 [Photobacterium kishitanii]
MNTDKEKTYESVKKRGTKDRKIFTSDMINIFANLVIAGLAGYTLLTAYTYKIPPEIIPVSESGSYFTKTPLNMRNKSDKEIKQWAADAVIKSFDFNFKNKEEHVANMSQIYSPDALSYLDKFINTGMLDARVRKTSGIVKMVLSDTINLESGLLKGRFAWRAEVKGALMLYSAEGMSRIGRYTIILNIMREDESITTSGLKVFSIQMKD